MLIKSFLFQANGYLQDSVEDKLQKIESEKDSLSLQVSVLTDQIDAQAEKIRDLEYCLAERREKLINAEDMLQSVSHYVISYFRSDCMLITNKFKNMSWLMGCFLKNFFL